MQTTEVTNLEYRTFLFDLLIQGKKDEFLKAKPDQAMWTKEYKYAFLKPMEEHYFSHAAYDEYPVVAISRALGFAKPISSDAEIIILLPMNLMSSPPSIIRANQYTAAFGSPPRIDLISAEAIS